MRKNNYLLLLSLVVMSTMAFTGCKTSKLSNSVTYEKQKSIVVIYDNDVHCGIDGYPKMAGLRDAISDTAYTALVSSGDFLQGGTTGALSHGQYIVDIMKTMDYDAITLGNHEFDYGVPAMLTLLDQVDNSRVACVNFRDMTGKRIYQPYIMKQMGNKKVAFIGAVTPTAMATEAYSFFDKDDKQIYDLAEKEVYQMVQEQVDEARKAGADYVIMITHLGEDKNAMNVDSHGLVEATNGIDIVLDGHSHSVIPHDVVINKDGKPIIVTQTGTKLANVGKLVISPDGKFSTELVPIANCTQVSEKVQHATDSIKNLMSELVNRKICKLDYDLHILDANGKQAVRRQETNAGDIVTDAYRAISGAEIAITNGGGIRSEAKAGDLTYGDVIAFLPYDNYLSVVEVTGSQLLDILETCTSFIPVEDGDFPQVSGLKFTVNASRETNRVTDLVILNKETNEYDPVDLDRTYQLATIDYCITGGGLRSKLKKNNVLKPSIMVYNECLIQYIVEHLNGHIGKEYAEPQGRITIVN